MKHLILRIAVICASGLFVSAIAQTNTDEMPDDSNPPAQGFDEAMPTPEMSAGQMDESAASDPETSATQTPSPVKNKTVAPSASATKVSSANQPSTSGASAETQTMLTPPSQASGANPDELRLNFNNVPLEMVLNYLSDAAGFIIVMDTQVHGTVSVISTHPMTRDEAVDLLNSVLNQNGYAAIRNGRTLTIMDKTEAKTRDIPVKVSNDPNNIPNNDEIVTQIIPIRFVDASQLVTDLSPFVSPQATIVANKEGNSVVITDTQANIRHLVEIIEAIDSSAQGETEIRVFPLKHANPSDVADELGQIFPNNGSSGGSQSQMPIRFRNPFFARMMGAGNNNNNQSAAIQKQSQVIAVADARTQSVIVTASKDLMEQIAGMIEQLDVSSARDQKVYVYHMNNGDPQQALQVLQGMFQNNSSSRSSSSASQTENSALIDRANQNATTVGNTSSTISSGATSSSNSRGAGGGGQ
ncbi:MAG: secretin N-terminal domain-containing protein [Limisphaerales bacterium]